MKRNAKATDERYNGWTNYETWNAAMWISNDEYSYWDERASEVADEAENEEVATHDLAEILGEHLRDNAPEVGGFYGDVLGAAIGSVNTHEIATHLIEDYREAIRERVQDEEHSEAVEETPDEQAGPCL